MKKGHGFTLIELLVVMMIIGLLVSMATINTNHDKRADLLKREAKRLEFFLEAVSDEAMFQNQNIGFEVTRNILTPYIWQIKPAANTNSNAAAQQATQSEYEWQTHAGRFIKPFELSEEDMEFELKIKGDAITLPYSANEKIEDVKPQFLVMANGQQSISDFKILINNYEGQATVKGFGLGRYYSSVEVQTDE
jgi:general secretion pathway protein H